MLRTRMLRVAVPIKPIVQTAYHIPAGKTLPPMSKTIEMSKEEMMASFEQMTRIRRLEMLSDKAYKDKMIRGFCHLYLGQEAICVGMQNRMTNEDSIVTGYRDHGWHVVRGGSCHEVLAEMFGKHSGCSKGKGGSMHLYKEVNKYYGGNGIVGAQVALGAGLAWSYVLKNGAQSPKNIAVALYGDGAANQGQVYETFNIAALHKIPIVFVCENNHFGMGTSEKRAAANSNFYTRGDAIPGVKVDGMNLFQIMETTRWAKEWCLGGNGPLVIEYDTYRYVGHSMSDPDITYRTKDDIKAVRDSRDPILHLKTTMLNNGWAKDEEFDSIETKLKQELAQVFQEATAAEDSRMSEQATDILTNQKEYYPNGVRHCQATQRIAF